MSRHLSRSGARAALALCLLGGCSTPGAGVDDGDRPVRVAVSASKDPGGHITPLAYGGGFETKTLIYETLVRRDATGRLVPALAASWRFEDGGKRVVFALREGARFHDGRPVDAASVRLHFLRWRGLPEHAWLRGSERILQVEATGPRELSITLDRPHALLPDLCAINPCAITGPATRNELGVFDRPVGSGPFRFERMYDDGRRGRYVRFEPESNGTPSPVVDLVRFEEGSSLEPLERLEDGEVDVVLDSWAGTLDRERLAALEQDGDYIVMHVPGSAVVYLSFCMEQGPTTDRRVRRAIAAAIDRDEFVRLVEKEYADPCTAWAAPSIEVWPAATAVRAPDDGSEPAPPVLTEPLRILVSASSERQAAIGRLLADQLREMGWEAVVAAKEKDAYAETLETRGYDVRIEQTWGVPYDPYISLVARFLPPPPHPTAASARYYGVDLALEALVEEATREPEQVGRISVYGRIQELMDREALVVPLYAPRRAMVRRAGLDGISIDHDLYRIDLTQLDDRR